MCADTNKPSKDLPYAVIAAIKILQMEGLHVFITPPVVHVKDIGRGSCTVELDGKTTLLMKGDSLTIHSALQLPSI